VRTDRGKNERERQTTNKVHAEKFGEIYFQKRQTDVKGKGPKRRRVPGKDHKKK